MAVSSFSTFDLSDRLSNLTPAASQREVGMSSEESSKVLVESVAKFLRRAHPTKTAAHVASRIGFSEYRVGKWLELSSAPNGSAMIALTAAYGPEFLAAVMPGSFAWLDAAARDAERDKLNQERAAIERRIAALNHPRAIETMGSAPPRNNNP